MPAKESAVKSSLNKTRNTELVQFTDFDPSRVVFSMVKKLKIPNSPLFYRSIELGYTYGSGEIGDLCLGTPRLFSFGVQENKSFTDPTKIDGHQCALVLQSKDGVTPEEKLFLSKFDSLVQKCIDHVINVQDELERDEDNKLTRAMLKKMDPVYRKKEKGKIVENAVPILNAKLMESKKTNKIFSLFFDVNEEPIEPLSLLGKFGFAEAAVKIDSIYIGDDKFKIQVRLHDAVYEPLERTGKPLMARKKGNNNVTVSDTARTILDVKDEDEDIEEGSLNGDEDVPVEQVKPVPKAPVKAPVKVEPVKRNVQKVGKKD